MTSIAKVGEEIDHRRCIFFQQLRAVIVRNLTIKLRQYFRTMIEVLLPVMVAANLLVQRPSFSVAPEIPWPTIDAGIYNPDGRLLIPAQWYIVVGPEAFSNRTDVQPFLNQLTDVVKEHLGMRLEINTTFETRDDFVAWYQREDPFSRYLLISLDRYQNGSFRYTISLDSNSVPSSKPTVAKLSECSGTSFVGTFYDTNNQCEAYRYYRSGFSTIQALMDSAIAKFHYGGSGTNFHPFPIPDIPNMHLGTFPRPAMLVSGNQHVTVGEVITLIAGTMSSFVAMVPISLVMEKEKKIKQAMTMMGLKTLPYWLGCLVVETFASLLSCVLVTAMLFNAIAHRLNIICLYLLFQMYAISIILLGFLLSIPFKSIKVASIFTILFAILIACSYMAVDALFPSLQVRLPLTIFSPLAFAFTIQQTLFTVQPVSLWSLQDFSFASGMLILFFDCCIYFFLTVLFDVAATRTDYLYEWFKRNKPEADLPAACDVEPVDEHLQRHNIIQIRSVAKVYDKNIVAVDNVTLDIYESQIFAILGQNGAGKTTLVRLITGAATPTCGKITIYGHNVHDLFTLAKLQTRFGICLQENILCDDLTPAEHLRFFAAIKGAAEPSPPHRRQADIDHLLAGTELTAERDKKSRLLSGGQKRKLCVAIALVGGSKIIFLDEPTSGVDPYSRQKIWDLLHAYKRNRVIILTTHLMQEADLLSDRKAIMVRGKIHCVGSSLFLKNRFGIGYHLRLDIDVAAANADLTLVDRIKALVLENILNAKLERTTKSELLFSLPKEETNRFPHLFNLIDQRIQHRDGILGYGINLTTLEDVFLKITYQTGIENDILEGKRGRNNLPNPLTDAPMQISMSPSSMISKDIIHRKPNTWDIYIAFLVVRFKLIIRNRTFLIGLIIQMFILLPIMMIVAQMTTKNTKLSLTGNLYPEDQRVLVKFADDQPENSSLITRFTPEIVERYLPHPLRPEWVDQIDLNITYNRHFAIEIEQQNLTLLINRTFKHALPVLQNAVTNMIVGYWMVGLSGHPLVIETNSHPLPDRNDLGTIIMGFIFTMLIGIMLVTFPVNLAVETVEDRSENIKNYLNVNGMRTRHYWWSTLTAHSLFFLAFITGFLSLVFLYMPTFHFLLQTPAIICLVILLLLYIPASLNVCYVLAHLFDKRDTAHGILNSACTYITIGLYIAAMLVDSGNDSLMYGLFYFLWPFFTTLGCLTKINLIRLHQVQQDDEYSPWNWNSNIIPAYCALIFHLCWSTLVLPKVDRIKNQNGSIWTWFIMMMTKRNRPEPVPSSPPEPEDSDVIEEKNRVGNLINSPTDETLLVLHNVTKIFPDDKIAVNDLNLAVESGQIFGLLGPNGAGKTTTMRIITREELQTSGTVRFQGCELKKRPRDLFSYCPQNSPFWKTLTVWEHLRLYATIRGIPGDRIDDVCHQLIKSFDIKEYRDREFEKLSGGNQRKLCLLIAIMADTKLTLLDEPSTGMDPKSKRLMWNLIIKNFEPNGQKSAILTSHAMEEVEALCTRLAIMAKGQMKCIGTVQHLNNKFGKGYILEIKTKDDFIEFEPIIRAIMDLFPHMTITERATNRIKITVPQDDVRSLGKFFDIMEKFKQNLQPKFEEYGLTQSSIEHVFIQLAKLHQQPE